MTSAWAWLAIVLYVMAYVVTTDAGRCKENKIGNGKCENRNNRARCDYDGGDCCSCTCVDGEHACGVNGFNCLDPEADCDTCITEWIGDGWCDGDNNKADCDYDGGDCCPCTCVDAEYECGVVGYHCLEVDCDAADPTPQPTPQPSPQPTPFPIQLP